MKFHLTPLEKKWVLYDVANSAFTMMVSTIIPIYFNALAKSAGISEVNYLAYWGYAISISTLIVAILGPTVGAASDRKGRKKRIFTAVILAGSILCLLLGFLRQWLIFLLVFAVAKTFYSVSLVIYDSTLCDITTEDRMDDVSSQGYAWGYIGSCVPFIACLLMVLTADKTGLGQMNALTLSLIITAVWWLVVSMPLLKVYEQRHYIAAGDEADRNIGAELWTSLKEIGRDRKVLLFLVAFFFYIDGVYMIIDMSTAYGSALGLGSTDMLLALLVTQFVAFPSAILMGKLSRTKDPVTLITICIAAYCGIAIFAFFMTQAWQFWVLAIGVGMFQGGIQALSRSYFTKIIPQEKSGAYFGFYDICGKGASFIGTTMMGLVSQLTGKVNYGVGVIAIFFIIGIVFFRMSAASAKTQR
ncbi:MFS transporter, UMF1 family [Lachnospiraceae bacterium NK3A20]|nr:MFS transporter, UMF1 family [Lachnospiraceae bacterium NK3A20]